MKEHCYIGSLAALTGHESSTREGCRFKVGSLFTLMGRFVQKKDATRASSILGIDKRYYIKFFIISLLFLFVYLYVYFSDRGANTGKGIDHGDILLE
jgi:hypothetical protein